MLLSLVSQTIGKNVVAARIEAGLSAGKLAQKIGWTRQRISDLERDRYKSPDVATLKLVAGGIGTTIDRLVHGVTLEAEAITKSAHDVTATFHSSVTNVPDLLRPTHAKHLRQSHSTKGASHGRSPHDPASVITLDQLEHRGDLLDYMESYAKQIIVGVGLLREIIPTPKSAKHSGRVGKDKSGVSKRSS